MKRLRRSRAPSSFPPSSACSASVRASLDGSRAVLLGEIKLQLEAGERELWLIERRGALEHRLGYVPVRGSIEDAVRKAKEQIDG